MTTIDFYLMFLVGKWIKSNKVDFLGIPSCVGFGLHADNYRSDGDV